MIDTANATAPGSSRPDRRDLILDAAGAVLLRYGYRKASVDEVAREAGASRQGVYLHFPTKDDLFAAAITHLLAATVSSTNAALDGPEPLEDRLLAAFAAMAGEQFTDRLDEILVTAERLTGRSPRELEGEIVAVLTTALERTAPDSPWRRHGDSAEAVARVLYATSAGMKRLAPTTSDYLDEMTRAIRLICSD